MILKKTKRAKIQKQIKHLDFPIKKVTFFQNSRHEKKSLFPLEKQHFGFFFSIFALCGVFRIITFTKAGMRILKKCHFSYWKINIFAFFQHFCFFCVIRIITLTKAGVRILKKRHFSDWKINIFGPEPSKSASLSQLGPPRGSNGPPNPHLFDQKSHIELPSRSVQIGSITTIAS